MTKLAVGTLVVFGVLAYVFYQATMNIWVKPLVAALTIAG